MEKYILVKVGSTASWQQQRLTFNKIKLSLECVRPPGVKELLDLCLQVEYYMNKVFTRFLMAI